MQHVDAVHDGLQNMENVTGAFVDALARLQSVGHLLTRVPVPPGLAPQRPSLASKKKHHCRYFASKSGERLLFSNTLPASWSDRAISTFLISADVAGDLS